MRVSESKKNCKQTGGVYFPFWWKWKKTWQTIRIFLSHSNILGWFFFRCRRRCRLNSIHSIYTLYINCEFPISYLISFCSEIFFLLVFRKWNIKKINKKLFSWMRGKTPRQNESPWTLAALSVHSTLLLLYFSLNFTLYTLHTHTYI